MASSEVGIASSAPPFGCVLRDHNWRDRINRENCSNVETTFEAKIKYFVQDISDSTLPKTPQNASVSPLDQEKSDETRQNFHKIRDDSSDEGSIETKTPGCVSSLVQRWRDFANTRHVVEKTSNPNSPSSFSSPLVNSNTNALFGKSNFSDEFSRETTCDFSRESFDTPCSENFDTPSMRIKDETFLDWDSQTGPPSNSEDGGERDRLRVADVIRKLKLDNESNTNTLFGKSNYSDEFSRETTCDLSRESFDTPCSENFDTPCRKDEPFLDWDSDKDGGERDRLRVADVIRKLKLDNESLGNGSEMRLKEQDKTPRIRGRQAFNDLLMQLERDRHVELDRLVERRAVSKFSHRGRIQSLLRLRFLRRDAIVRHHHQKQQTKVIGPQQHYPSTLAPQQQSEVIEASTNVDSPQISSSTPIGFENRKLEAAAEQNSHSESAARDEQHSESLPSQHNQIGQGSKVVLLREKFDILDKTDAATQKTPKGIAKSYSLCSKSSLTSNQLREEFHQQQQVTNTTLILCPSQNSISKDIEEHDQTNANHEDDNICPRELGKAIEGHDQTNPTSLKEEANYEVANICSTELEKGHENYQEPCDNQVLESGEEWGNGDVQYWSEWYEEDISNLDWVSDIARPKSDWENLRQARYRDMLDSEDENDEMRRLLERKSVSTFLTSSLRDAIDQLMISRVEIVPHSTEDHDEHRLEQFVISPIQTQTNVENQEGQDGNFPEQAKYPSLEQPQSSQSSCPDTQPFSALTNRSSIDTDYMYDMRAYMEQLHQEVSELRKTINRCMDMQEKMQCSIKQEVAAAVDLSVERALKGSANNTTGASCCRLCYEMQVDTLFYRCGHMCTCFKCAHELQWSTGKCPICRAPIVDVVLINRR